MSGFLMVLKFQLYISYIFVFVKLNSRLLLFHSHNVFTVWC